MIGRCEKDPFEAAVDVCHRCYGEYCWDCLVPPKKRQKPLCQECALALSGLRPKSKPPVRGSKKTVKARREALRPAREAPRTAPNNFTYVDPNRLVTLPTETAETQIHDPQEQPPAPIPSTTDGSAVRQLTELRESDQVAPPEPAPALPPTPTLPPTSTDAPDSIAPLPAEAVPPPTEPVQFPSPRPYSLDPDQLAEYQQADEAPQPAADHQERQPIDHSFDINDDPWARIPEPVEHDSDGPPAWTTASLPKISEG